MGVETSVFVDEMLIDELVGDAGPLGDGLPGALFSRKIWGTKWEGFIGEDGSD